MKKCGEVMTKNIVCCMPHDTVVKAAQMMDSKGIGAVPVIENENTQKLVGIVTDWDLALGVVAKGLNPNTTSVAEVMTRDVMTCHAEDDLQIALDAMSEYRLCRIPIVDNAHKILGIIAQADVATRVDQPEKTANMLRGISQRSVFAQQNG